MAITIRIKITIFDKIIIYSNAIISTIGMDNQIITRTGKYCICKICSLEYNVIHFYRFIDIITFLDDILSVSALKHISVFFIVATIKNIIAGTTIEDIRTMITI